MLRLAERHKVSRKDFLDRYVDHELDESWLAAVEGIDKKWRAFCENEAGAVDASAPRSPRSARPPA